MNFPRSLIETPRGARRIMIFTGAGVSHECGIPTFRDRQTGLWANFDAAELATPEAFDHDAAFVWGWYERRRAAVRDALPNTAHRAIAELASRVPESCRVPHAVSDVQPAASFTDLAVEAGAVTVQVNPSATGIEQRVSFALRGEAGSGLPSLLECAWPPRVASVLGRTLRAQ